MQNQFKLRTIILGGLTVALAIAALVLTLRSTPTKGKGGANEDVPSYEVSALAPSSLDGVCLSIEILREESAPVSGASISLTNATVGSTWWRHPPIALRKASSDGTASFELRPGQYQLSVNAPGYLPHNEQLQIAGDDMSLTVQLRTGGHIVTGIVEDSGGGIITGASVTLVNTISSGPSNLPIRAVTDESGTYQTSVPAGVYSSRATADGYVSQSSLIQLPPRREHHNFALLPAAVAEGHITHCDSGRPAVGIKVIVTSQPQSGNSDTEQKFAPTETSGAFRIEGLPFGEHRISARGDSLASLSGTTISLGLGETASAINICVSIAYAASGHIRDQDGKPVANALIETTAISNRTHIQATASDEMGRFKVEGLIPGEYGLAATSAKTPESSALRVSISNNDLGEIELTINSGIKVTGKVSPPQRASITVHPKSPNPPIDQTLRALQTELIVTAESADDGFFELSGLPPGDWSIVATAADGALGEEPLHVDTADIDDITIELEEQASLHGQVVTESGSPVPSARVIMINSDMTFLQGAKVRAGRMGVPVSDLGEFKFQSIEPGSYALLATDRNGMLLHSRPVHIAQNGDLIWVNLSKGEHLKDYRLVVEADLGRIRGTVKDSSGIPLADVDIRVRNQGSDLGPSTPRQTVSDTDGNFSFDGLRLSNHSLTAHAYKEGQSLSLPKVAVSKEPAPIELTLMEQGKVSGKVSNIKAADFCTIELLGTTTRQAHTQGPHCNYTFDHLDQGSYEISVTTQSCAGNATLSLSPGQSENTEVDCQPFATVSGQIVDSDGTPMANLSVIAASPDGGAGALGSARELAMGLLRQTDEGGYFKIPRLHPGTLVLVVLAPDKPEGLIRKVFSCSPGEHCDLGVIAKPPS